MSLLEVNGTQLHYEEHGEGEPMLLLHGALGTAQRHFQHLIPALSPHFRVVACDLRGHGQTQHPRGPITLDHFLGDVIGLMDALGILGAHFVGYSMGGYLALALHLRQPERVRSIVFHAVKYYWTPESIREMVAGFDPDVMLAKQPKLAAILQADHGTERWKMLLADLTPFQQGFDGPALLTDADFGRASCPILATLGDRDELIPLDEVIRLRKANKTSELAIMPNTRHPIQTVNPELFSWLVRDFIRRRVG